MNAYLALWLSIVIGAAGQISLKAGVVGAVGRKGAMPDPYVWAGLSLYLISALLYIRAIRDIPISRAFPSVSVSYVAVAFLAHVMWGETFGSKQVLALLFIGAGTFMLFR